MPCPRPPNDREAILASLQALLDNLDGPARLDVQTCHGHTISYTVPPPPPPPDPAPRDDDERDCRADILAVLREAGRRLTTKQILDELTRRQWFHGERTVQRRLAEMVGVDIDNDPRARPPGYAPIATATP